MMSMREVRDELNLTEQRLQAILSQLSLCELQIQHLLSLNELAPTESEKLDHLCTRHRHLQITEDLLHQRRITLMEAEISVLQQFVDQLNPSQKSCPHPTP
jgi:hypothetical protein